MSTRDYRTEVVREAVATGATSGQRKLERGTQSLVALLHSAYLTTNHLTARPRVGERQVPVGVLPSGFLKPMPVWRRVSRRGVR